MSWLSLSDVADMTSGKLLNSQAKDVAVNGVGIDTRKIKSDELFIAIKGERFDAHHFVQDLEGKVAAALVSEVIDCDVPQVLVKDTKLALAALAQAWRSRFTEAVIGLTGSNGKTTLKEMVSAILSQEGNVLATLGNFNNDIGMPLTILRIRDEHDYAVIEMGANHFDEIDFLTNIAKPNIAVINNAGPAHLEGFGDVEGVSRAKGEIFNGLAEDGIAIINADDDYADYWKSLNKGHTQRKVITFGIAADADVSGVYQGGGLLTVKVNKDEAQVQLNLQGKHNAMNALAATSVAVALGVDLQTVKKGLESLQAVPGRLAIIKGMQGCNLLDDTYNANPASVNAAIDVLAEVSGTRVMVLGDMGELGGNDETIKSIHADIGAKANHAGIEKMFCFGKYSAKACEGFGSPENAYSEMDELTSSLISTLKNNIGADMTILVKGSRSAHMERVVDVLRAEGSS